MPQFDENIYLNIISTNRKGYLSQLGIVHPDPRYRFNERRLGRHLFDYVVSGQGYVECGGEAFEVEAGDLVYVAKWSRASYGADPYEPYEKIWFGAEGTAIEALIKCYLGDKRLAVRKNAPIEPFLRLKSIVSQSEYDEKAVMKEILEIIMCLSELPEHSESDGHRELALRIRDYIDHRLDANLSLDELADEFHLSKRHVIRVFKEKYGETPSSYHAEARFKAATRYLADTTLSVGEIAQELGYCDQSFFSQTFKKYCGHYPTEYRRLERELQNAITESSPKE